MQVVKNSKRVKELEQDINFYFESRSKVRPIKSRETSAKPDAPHPVRKKKPSLSEGLLFQPFSTNVPLLHSQMMSSGGKEVEHWLKIG